LPDLRLRASAPKNRFQSSLQFDSFATMIIKTAEFITSAVKPGQYPASDFPEVAFAGRSNVGKSSLINTLVQRRHLVKTSSTPGRTQLINFFLINAGLSMVDLPGYGYAKVPVSVKKQWGPMVETYLSQRSCLKAVVLLLDVRRTPRAEESRFMAWLQHYRIPFVLVLTKSDKLSKSNQKQQQNLAANTLEVAAEELILFSAKTRQGVEFDGTDDSERLKQ
jgi:GTP-binding protein